MAKLNALMSVGEPASNEDHNNPATGSNGNQISAHTPLQLNTMLKEFGSERLIGMLHAFVLLKPVLSKALREKEEQVLRVADLTRFNSAANSAANLNQQAAAGINAQVAATVNLDANEV